MAKRGLYIVLEGSDGTGKDTQAELLAEAMKKNGRDVLSVFSIEHNQTKDYIKEPGGTPFADQLRTVLLNKELPRDGWSNVMLFTSARRSTWYDVILPALNSGKDVIATRSWISTIAYQGYGEGIPLEKIVQRTREDVGEEYMNPDILCIFTLDESARTKRIDARGDTRSQDTFESKSETFQQSMKDGYAKYANDNGIDLIDATLSKEEVHEIVWKRIATRI